MKKLIITTMLLIIPAISFSKELTTQEQLNNLADNVVEITLQNMQEKIKNQKQFEAVSKIMAIQNNINQKADWTHADIYKKLEELKELNRQLEIQIDLIK